jgi:hypothetical protein
MCISSPHRTQAMGYQDRQEAWAKDTHEVCVMHTWFFFEIINKSIAQHVSGPNAAEAIDDKFLQSVKALLLQMVNMVRSCDVDSTSCAPRMLSAIGFFLRDLLSYIKCGAVFAIVHDIFKMLHMDVLMPGSVGVDERACYRLDMLEILCSHEHYVALNIPLDVPDEVAADEISSAHLDKHYLSGYEYARSRLPASFDVPR